MAVGGRGGANTGSWRDTGPKENAELAHVVSHCGIAHTAWLRGERWRTHKLLGERVGPSFYGVLQYDLGWSIAGVL